MNQYKIYHVLGLMSGSSLDGLDIAHCMFQVATEGKIAVNDWEIIAGTTIPYSEEWQDQLKELPTSTALELAKADVQFGQYIGALVKEYMDSSGELFDFIASHGHTIFHYPQDGFTTQIGSGAAIAATTGLNTLCDFRSVDIALGGQGAPVVGIADKMLFSQYELLLNLGGICNLTKQYGNEHFSFDISVCNQVLNALANEMDKPYDNKGEIARSGHVNKQLYKQINLLPYFKQAPPKSLDNQWVAKNLTQPFLDSYLEPEDMLATAVDHIAFQIANAIEATQEEDYFKQPKMMVTGGGAFNDFLVARIEFHCRDLCKVELPDKNIIKYKEALLMGLMGVLRMLEKPNCFPKFTGASEPNVGGAIYKGHSKNH